MNFDKKQLRNTLLLLLGALIWGTAFVAQSVGSGYVGPYTFLAARSWLACAFLIVLVLLRRGKARKADPGVPFWINGRMLLRGGAFCGIALFAASAAQQIGIGTTSTAKAGFLTALYVVLVPLLGVFFGRRPGVKLGICACISLAGLYLLCLAGHDTLTLTGGEWMLLLCSLLFAFQIMLVDHYSPRLDGVQLSFAEFLQRRSFPLFLCLCLKRRPLPRSRGRRYPLLTAAFCPAVWPTRCKLWARKNLTPPLPAWPCAWKACSAPWPAG